MPVARGTTQRRTRRSRCGMRSNRWKMNTSDQSCRVASGWKIYRVVPGVIREQEPSAAPVITTRATRGDLRSVLLDGNVVRCALLSIAFVAYLVMGASMAGVAAAISAAGAAPPLAPSAISPSSLLARSFALSFSNLISPSQPAFAPLVSSARTARVSAGRSSWPSWMRGCPLMKWA